MVVLVSAQAWCGGGMECSRLLSCAPTPSLLWPSLADCPAEETQQCADTATEHVGFLEEKVEADRSEHEAAAAALQEQLEAARGEAAAAQAALAEAQAAAAANLEAAAEAAAAELVRVQVGLGVLTGPLCCVKMPGAPGALMRCRPHWLCAAYGADVLPASSPLVPVLLACAAPQHLHCSSLLCPFTVQFLQEAAKAKYEALQPAALSPSPAPPHCPPSSPHCRRPPRPSMKRCWG